MVGEVESHAIAEARGLVAGPTLTTTCAEVLVNAEIRSQPSKAWNTERREEPVNTKDFLKWLDVWSGRLQARIRNMPLQEMTLQASEA